MNAKSILIHKIFTAHNTWKCRVIFLVYLNSIIIKQHEDLWLRISHCLSTGEQEFNTFDFVRFNWTFWFIYFWVMWLLWDWHKSHGSIKTPPPKYPGYDTKLQLVVMLQFEWKEQNIYNKTIQSVYWQL